MSIQARVYWNNNSYGNVLVVRTRTLQYINLLLSVVVVGLYPVPLALIFNKLLSYCLGDTVRIPSSMFRIVRITKRWYK